MLDEPFFGARQFDDAELAVAPEPATVNATPRAAVTATADTARTATTVRSRIAMTSLSRDGLSSSEPLPAPLEAQSPPNPFAVARQRTRARKLLQGALAEGAAIEIATTSRERFLNHGWTSPSPRTESRRKTSGIPKNSVETR